MAGRTRIRRSHRQRRPRMRPADAGGVMYLRAALSVIPRPRPSSLPSTVVTFTATPSLGAVAAYNSVCGYALADTLPPLYPHVMAFGPTMKLMSGNDFPFPV